MKKVIYNKYFKWIMLLIITVSIITCSVIGIRVESIGSYYSEANGYVGHFDLDDIFCNDFTESYAYRNIVNAGKDDISLMAYSLAVIGLSDYEDIHTDYIYVDDNGNKWTFEDIQRANCEEYGDESENLTPESFSYIFSNNLLEQLKQKYNLASELEEEVYNCIYNRVLEHSKSVASVYNGIGEVYYGDGYVTYYEYADDIDEYVVGREILEKKIDLDSYDFENCIEYVKYNPKAIYENVTEIDNISTIHAYACSLYTSKKSLEKLPIQYEVKLNNDLTFTNIKGEMAKDAVFMEYDLPDYNSYDNVYNYSEYITTSVIYDGEVVNDVLQPAGVRGLDYIIEGKMYVLNDGIQYLKDTYEKVVSHAFGYIVMFVIAFIAFVIANILLLIGAGHSSNKDGVAGLGIDNIFLEIRACVLFASIILQVGILCMWFDFYCYGFSFAIILSTVLFICDWFVTLGLVLSFKRSLIMRKRIEGYSLKNNIFCVRIVRFLKKRFLDKDAVVRSVIMFGGYILLMLFVVMATLVTESFFVFFMLAVIVNAATLLFIITNMSEYNKIVKFVKRVSEGNFNEEFDTTGFHYMNKTMATHVSNITCGLNEAVNEKMKSERMKTDLITNVSHDIKTPLTSIINYVDLLKKENLNNETANEYLDILDAKSQRLKVLIEDLIEASKLSSKVVTVRQDEINLTELVYQTNGEFEEKFAKKNLNLICNMPEERIMITGDGRKIFRVLENIYNNVYKYALANTRVYLNVSVNAGIVVLELKNISESELNIDASELTERFVRGDISRNTEGSGLGLSIASNIVELHGGSFEIVLDGDLFKIIIRLPKSNKNVINELDENKIQDN